MRLTKRLLTSVCPVAVLAAPFAMGITPAFAQSTATQEIETVVVTGTKANISGGLFIQQEIAKTRSVINQDFIQTQIDGQSVVAQLNLLPGVSINNNDPYGASGGDIRLRGYPSNHISVELDGIPLNDTGNYAIYIGEYMDAAIVDHVTVNTGTTDVDSPTASATGGTINIVTKIPDNVMSIGATATAGSYDYRHFNLIGQTGEFGPWGTKAYLQVSYMDYEKFRGYGDLVRRQANFRVYQDLGGGDFISLAGNWDPNDNYAYRSNSKAAFANKWTNIAAADYTLTCQREAHEPVQGQADTEALCNNAYSTRVNPSSTGNIRGQSLFTLTDNLKFTFDPSVQYVLADGGAQDTTIFENDPRLVGSSTGTGTTTNAYGCIPGVGCDLNGDGDVKDKVNVVSPSVTETRRWGVSTSLIWTPMEKQLFDFSYTLDYGLHRQTGVNGYLRTDPTAMTPEFEHWYGGIVGHPVMTADGHELRYRDRKSYAILNQVSGDYEGDFFDDMLHVSVGVRAPFFERDLNQYCYTVEKAGTVGPNSGTFSPGATAYCTTQTPTPINVAANSVAVSTVSGVNYYLPAGSYSEFVGGSGTPAILDAPYKLTRKYNRVLPNVGLSLKPWGDEHQFYLAYAKTMSAPVTDDLYVSPLFTVAPETAETYDAGYRYTGINGLTGEVDVWHAIFQNHIVSSYDDATGYNVDRNVGPVNLSGFDVSVGAQPIDNLTLYGTLSWENTHLKDNLIVSGTPIATAGKALVETPKWMMSGRVQYVFEGLKFGLQGKYTGRRYSTDLNDNSTSPYIVLDSDITYDLSRIGWDGAQLQFNVTNLTNKFYFGSISSTNTAAQTPFFYPGAPRTFTGTIRVSL